LISDICISPYFRAAIFVSRFAIPARAILEQEVFIRKHTSDHVAKILKMIGFGKKRIGTFSMFGCHNPCLIVGCLREAPVSCCLAGPETEPKVS
jgi:hypothetical protein